MCLWSGGYFWHVQALGTGATPQQSREVMVDGNIYRWSREHMYILEHYMERHTASGGPVRTAHMIRRHSIRRATSDASGR